MTSALSKKILVTGAAGFIGFHVAKRLLEEGHTVVGVDNLNSYYSVQLKKDRLKQLESFEFFQFYCLDVADHQAMEKMWQQEKPITHVVHLAAQAGVRYSLIDPYPYVHSNVTGFMVMLEQCRYQENFEHLVYASTSSVYGLNPSLPFKESDPVEHPISLYAATKRANELMAQSYYHLYRYPITGLRLFTVYGPWGRPDMSLFKFTKAILAGETIDVYNHGQMSRDYTYISDIVDGILAALWRPASVEPREHPLYNLGNDQKQSLMTFIEALEEALGRKANKNFLPLQPGDIVETSSDIQKAKVELGYCPKVDIHQGIAEFVEWYKTHTIYLK
ncbi:SDR family NAD(P)-dependent oxidoreductase [Candidatus Finniella inopinata]|uniref:SDR family NAD(P)-dependent oxidoreductase n=1 Tax=Candidatus Finniella inopinata TaxID=1696036 RepID=A0A4Q7DKE3_9PROT|nr:SDR family NAD(P)-dependent oxidoreductase [Candidatus Finniella inopinata]RZI46544.1 SDR family NAD(P)-dependent oxidoreductase [Candidatus Finniella inopinata]